MSNKITNDDSFQNYIGKYITLTENGVKKKFYVSEITKSSFISNVSILQGVSGTDFTFTSSGVKQKCDICEDACVYNVPVLQIYFRGMNSANYSNFAKKYYDEKHEIYINNHKICTVDTSILSANENIIYVIFSNTNNLKININDVWDYNRQFYPITSTTSSFSAVYCDPIHYNFRDVNAFHSKPVYANNPNNFSTSNPPWGRGYPVPWYAFYTSFFALAAPTTCLHRQKIITNTDGTSSLGCIKWLCNDFAGHDQGSGFAYLATDFVDGYVSTYARGISCVFYDFDPCVNPNDYIEGYIFDTTKYFTYTNDYPSISTGVYNYYPYYERTSQTPASSFGCPTYFTRTVMYSSTVFSEQNRVVVYNPTWEGATYTHTWTFEQEQNVVPNFEASIFLDLGLTPFNGILYNRDLKFNPVRTYRYTVINGRIDTQVPV